MRELKEQKTDKNILKVSIVISLIVGVLLFLILKTFFIPLLIFLLSFLLLRFFLLFKKTINITSIIARKIRKENPEITCVDLESNIIDAISIVARRKEVLEVVNLYQKILKIIKDKE